MLTLHALSICYDIGGIILANEIRKKKCMGRKSPLLVRTYCFDKSIEHPSSSGRASAKQKKDQSKITKKRQMSEQAERGKRKGRKRDRCAVRQVLHVVANQQ